MSTYEPAKRAVRVARKDVLYSYLGIVAVVELAAWIARSRGLHFPPQVYMFPLYTLAPMIAWTAQPRQRREGRVRVDDQALTLDGRPLVTRKELTLGVVRREGDATWLRLSGKGKWGPKVVDVAVADGAEAETILSVLGLDAKSRTAVFDVFNEGKNAALLTALGGFFAATLVGIVAASRYHFPAAAFLIGLCVMTIGFMGALIASAKSQRTKLTVGVDGLRIEEGFKKTRFVAHDQIRDANATEGILVLSFADGTRARYRCGQKQRRRRPGREGEDQKLAEAIVDKLQAARAAFDELSGDVGNVPALARARRSPKEWLEALRAIAEGASAGYREGLVPRERLLRVAESAHAPETSRLAAAVVLAENPTDEEKARLEALATASASPALQKRFRIATDPKHDDALIEKMLEEAAAEEESGGLTAKTAR